MLASNLCSYRRGISVVSLQDKILQFVNDGIIAEAVLFLVNITAMRSAKAHENPFSHNLSLWESLRKVERESDHYDQTEAYEYKDSKENTGVWTIPILWDLKVVMGYWRCPKRTCHRREFFVSCCGLCNMFRSSPYLRCGRKMEFLGCKGQSDNHLLGCPKSWVGVGGSDSCWTCNAPL